MMYRHDTHLYYMEEIPVCASYMKFAFLQATWQKVRMAGQTSFFSPKQQSPLLYSQVYTL
jgi:hypothetical protein